MAFVACRFEGAEERAGELTGRAMRRVWPLVNAIVWAYALDSLCRQLALRSTARGWLLVLFVVVWSALRSFILAAREDRRR